MYNVDDDDPAFIGCRLRAGGNVIDTEVSETLGENPNINPPESAINFSETYPLQAVVTDFGGGAITVECFWLGKSDRVDTYNAIITAIRVGSVE